MVSTWNTKCGIAETTRAWLNDAGFTYKVFAPVEPPNAFIAEDDSRVIRCWDREFNSYDNIREELLDFSPNVVHFQHETSFFWRHPNHEKNFFALIEDLRNRKIKVVVTIHTYSPSAIIDRLADCVDKVIVTKDLEDTRDNPRYIPIDLPVPQIQRLGKEEAKRKLNWVDKPRFVVGSFGMWNPHKGFKEFLDTYNDVALRAGCDTRYMIVGHRPSRNMYAQDVIRNKIDMLDTKKLVLFTDYEPTQDVADKLCAADVLVYNYSIIGYYSASAAIRDGMSVGRPIICSHSPMFNEFDHEKHVLKVASDSQQELVESILRLQKDVDLQRTLVENCDKFISGCTPQEVAKKHIALYKDLLF